MASRNNFVKVLQGNRPSRGLVWGVLILSALFAFEIFNYSTTEFAMYDLLGDLRFAGIRWSTILAIAFCGIDFAGIARAVGLKGLKIEKPDEIKPAITAAMDSDRPAVIDVKISPEPHFRLMM